MDLTDEHITWARRQAKAVARRWPSVPLQDLEQEALIITWRLMCDYDPARNDNWQGFAWETVRSTLLKRCEQFHRWSARHRLGIPAYAEPTVDHDEPHEPTDEQAAVQRLVSVLSPLHAAIVQAHVYEERTFASIAKQRGCSQQYVAQLWGEAIAAMRSMNRYLRKPA